MGVKYLNRHRIIIESAPLKSSLSQCRVAGVETEHGVIECDYFVNCSGIWAREIGKLSEPPVKVPICPAEHFFLSFKGNLMSLVLG